MFGNLLSGRLFAEERFVDMMFLVGKMFPCGSWMMLFIPFSPFAESLSQFLDNLDLSFFTTTISALPITLY